MQTTPAEFDRIQLGTTGLLPRRIHQQRGECVNKATIKLILPRLVVGCLFLGSLPASAAPFAYVPLHQRHEIAAIDTATNSIVDRLAGNFPFAIAIVEQLGRVYVSNPGNDTVSVFDMTTHNVITTIETSGFQPSAMVADPSGKRIYVTTGQTVGSEIVGLIEIIDTSTNTLSGDPIAAGHIAFDFAVHPTGRFLYSSGVVTLDDEEQKLFVIDISTRSQIAQLSLKSATSLSVRITDLVIDPVDGKTIYVAYGNDVPYGSDGILRSEVAVIDASTNTVSATLLSIPDIPGESEITGLALNPTGSRLYVTRWYGGYQISVIDTSTGMIVEEIDWEEFFVNLDGYRDVVPRWLSTDAAGRLLYVITGNPNEFAVVDAVTHTLIAIFPLSSPETFVFGSLGDFVGHPDSDGDGLFDTWESVGIDYDGDGVIDFKPAKADPNHKDLYVEIDWMDLHKPDIRAISNVINAFEAAPATALNNPDGDSGVQLHVEIDEKAVEHNEEFSFVPCTARVSGLPDYDIVKSAFFGSRDQRESLKSVSILNAKRMVYRYGLFVHSQLGTASSGCAELPGNDFVVSLGRTTVIEGHPVGSTDQQGGTFMHELGHTLGLTHGGRDFVNCKPNYLSVMNYIFQLNHLVEDRPLDYSHGEFLTLHEGDLNETHGIGGPTAHRTVYGPQPLVVSAADGPIDWNRDGDAMDASVASDINNFGGGGCDGVGSALHGHNDWPNLRYNFRSAIQFDDGARISEEEEVPDELTFEEALEISLDGDEDGVKNLIDNCPSDPNPNQMDSNDDGVGDECEDFLTVEIDVKPGSFPNIVNLKSNGVVPTAVISSLSFDARSVLPESVSLSGATVKLTGKGKHYLCNEEDVNQDGLLDMLCHVNIAEFLLEEGESIVVLEARTSDGPPIRGEDTIKVVPGN